MSKFKVGDRVAVYGNIRAYRNEVCYMRGDKATVTAIVDYDEIIVKLDDGSIENEVHPNQCRRLKKVPVWKEIELDWVHANGDYGAVVTIPEASYWKTVSKFIGKRTKVRVKVIE